MVDFGRFLDHVPQKMDSSPPENDHILYYWGYELDAFDEYIRDILILDCNLK